MHTHIKTICLFIIIVLLSGCTAPKSANAPQPIATTAALDNLILIKGNDLIFQGTLSGAWRCGENHTIDIDMPVLIKGIKAKFSLSFDLLPETRITFTSGKITTLADLRVQDKEYYLPDHIPVNNTIQATFFLQENGSWGISSLQEIPLNDDNPSSPPEISDALAVDILARGETSALLSGSNFDGEEYRWLADIPVSFHGGKATLVLPMYLTNKTQIINEEGQHVKPDGQIPPDGWQEVRFTHKNGRLELVNLTTIPPEDQWTE